MEFRVVSMKSEIHCSSQSNDKDLRGMHFLSMNCIEFDFALKIEVNIITEVSIEFYVKNLRLYHEFHKDYDLLQVITLQRISFII